MLINLHDRWTCYRHVKSGSTKMKWMKWMESESFSDPDNTHVGKMLYQPWEPSASVHHWLGTSPTWMKECCLMVHGSMLMQLSEIDHQLLNHDPHQGLISAKRLIVCLASRCSLSHGNRSFLINTKISETMWRSPETTINNGGDLIVSRSLPLESVVRRLGNPSFGSLRIPFDVCETTHLHDSMITFPFDRSSQSLTHKSMVDNRLSKIEELSKIER